MNSKFLLDTEKLKHEKKTKRIIKLTLLILLLLLALLYFVFGIIYNSGNFSITLDKNLYFENKIIIYDDPNYKEFRSELYADGPETFDNISYKWLPNDLYKGEGEHNGYNYLAYSFYVENTGENTVDFWTETVIDDVIKNVDDAVRIRIYKDEQYVTYAKLGANGSPEKDTTPFVSDKLINMDHIENFKPGDKIKYTIVLWLEGTDLECTDNILGGEFKVHMEFNSEFVDY